MIQNTFPFGNQEHLPFFFSYYTETVLMWDFQNTVPSENGTFYNWWKLPSWTSGTSLNTCIPEMYAGVLSLSYLVYRGSLISLYDIWSRIKNKQRILSNKYPKEMYFYVMKETSDSKELDCIKFDMMFRYYLKCDCHIILLTCVYVCLCVMYLVTCTTGCSIA
jgi:hypothetical protein